MPDAATPPVPAAPRRAYRRARRPAEKEQRRAAILAAAAALVDEQGLYAVSLSAVAARCGLTKSNLYRYFESREAVLLALFTADLAALAAGLQRALARVAPGDVPGLGRALARAFLARPRLCRFLGAVPAVLEEGVSDAAIAQLKRETLASAGPVAAALHRALPALGLPGCLWAAQATAMLVAGFYPPAHPGPATRRVLEQPEFAAFRLRPQADLARAIAALLRGMLGE
jgi:AcrR family transcriptional regulator